MDASTSGSGKRWDFYSNYGASELRNILMNWERDTSWSDPLFQRPEKLLDASWHPFKPLVPIYLWVKNHGGHQNSFGCSCPPSIPIRSMTFQTSQLQEMELQSRPWHCNLLTSWHRLIFNHFMPFGHNMPRHHRSVRWVSPGFKCVKQKKNEKVARPRRLRIYNISE